MGDDDHWPYVGFDRHTRFRLDILDALRSFAYGSKLDSSIGCSLDEEGHKPDANATWNGKTP